MRSREWEDLKSFVTVMAIFLILLGASIIAQDESLRQIAQTALFLYGTMGIWLTVESFRMSRWTALLLTLLFGLSIALEDWWYTALLFAAMAIPGGWRNG